MSEKKLSIGFDRYIEKAWLDQIAVWVSEGRSRDELHSLVDEYLSPYINGETSLRKTKNVLFGVWVNKSRKNESFKAEAINLYRHCQPQERVVIHWGLAVASYPFFASLSRLIGRLLRLQDDIVSKELVRRSVEIHGDTETVRRATARLLQSFGEWGILSPESKSLFHPTNKIYLEDPSLVSWLMESVFHSSEKERHSLDELLSDPVWFPFQIQHNAFQLSKASELEIVHQGAGGSLISLKKLDVVS